MDAAQLEQRLTQLREEERQAFGQLVFIQGRVTQILEILGRDSADEDNPPPSIEKN